MLSAILQGASSYVKVFDWVRKYELAPYFWMSAVFSLLIGGLVIWGISLIYDDLGAWISAIWVWEWGKEAFTRIAEGFAFLAALFVFLFTFKYLVFILMAPILSLVSQKMERLMLGQTHDSGMGVTREFVRGIRLTLRNIVREMLLTLSLLLVGVLLPFLSAAMPIALFIVQAYYAGFGNMDYTLERYHDLKGSVEYVSRKKGLAIGNGSVFLALLALPIIGMLIAPFLGAVSATHDVLSDKIGASN